MSQLSRHAALAIDWIAFTRTGLGFQDHYLITEDQTDSGPTIEE